MEPGDRNSWEYSLRKYLLLLATLVATVTYAAGFNPPGGVWQDTDPAAGHLAGDPIIRHTSYRRYLVFFYCNATAFASSLVVIVLILLLSVLHDHKQEHEQHQDSKAKLAPLHTLRVVMTLDLLSLIGAYAAGSCRDALTTAYSAVLVVVVVAYVVIHTVRALSGRKKEKSPLKQLRKVLMLLATFAMSVTYLAGLSAPGGFWGADAGGGHRPGDAVLLGRHDARLKVFFVCNNTAFAASLLIVVLLLDKKLEKSDKLRSWGLNGFIFVALVGLVGAYTAGSCRQIDTTIYVTALVGAVLLCILVQVVVATCFIDGIKKSWLWTKLQDILMSVSDWLQARCDGEQKEGATQTENGNGKHKQRQAKAMEEARSLVLLLATLAATITYQAGLDPPGGLWQNDGDGYKAGDPILLTNNSRRYKAFFYCNSIAFVASLVAIVLVQQEALLDHHALEAAMILDLFGLIGAYAAGSCRDVTTSIYAMALAGAVLVYVVIHVVFFTLDHEDNVHHGNGIRDKASLEKNDPVERRRKRLLLFAILAATITYQAGLTPPSGFRLQDDGPGHYAGDPVLLYNFPRRYKAFFYCNSVSFMLSIALIILLVNRNLYRPAIQSNALSVCTAAGMFGLIGAYGAGSTQHLKTSIYIFALAAVVLSSVVLLVVVLLVIYKKNGQDLKGQNIPTNEQSRRVGPDEEIATPTAQNRTEESSTPTGEKPEKRGHAKRKYLMLLGILVASVTYQTGLEPPGGVWQGDGGGHVAGDPVMHDNRRPRYLAFFYSNSTSFVASIVVIILLLAEYLKEGQNDKSESPQEDKVESPQKDEPESLPKDAKPGSQEKVNWWFGVMNTTIVLDLLGLLGAYAAGSSRSWRRTGYVFGFVVAVLGYVAIHVLLSCLYRKCHNGRRP